VSEVLERVAPAGASATQAAEANAAALMRAWVGRSGSPGALVDRVGGVDQVGIVERVESLRKRSIKRASHQGGQRGHGVPGQPHLPRRQARRDRGIRTAKEAIQYLVVLYETLGPRWMTPERFRFGASSLLNDVVQQLQRERTGHYSGPDHVTID